MKIVPGFLVLLYYIGMCMPPKISNAFFQMFLTGQTLRGDASIVPCKYFLGAQQTIYDFSWRDKGIPPLTAFYKPAGSYKTRRNYTLTSHRSGIWKCAK